MNSIGGPSRSSPQPVQPEKTASSRASSARNTDQVSLQPGPLMTVSSTDKSMHRRLVASHLNQISESLQNQLNRAIERPGDNHSLVKARDLLTDHVISLTSRYPVARVGEGLHHANILSIEHAARISLAYEMMVGKLPKGELRELCGLLAQHIKTAWVTMQVDEIKQNSIQKLEQFRNPETFKSHKRSMGINVWLGSPLLEANGVRAIPLSATDKNNFGLGKKDELYIDPEGLVFLNKHVESSYENRAGVNLSLSDSVGATFSGGVSMTKDDVKLEMFNNIEDFVEKKGHERYVAKAHRDQYEGVPSSGGLKQFTRNLSARVNQLSEISNLEKDQQQALNNRDRLGELLRNILHIPHADINAPAPDRSRALSGYSSRVTATLSGEARASMFAGGGFNVSLSKQIFDFHLFVPSNFTDVIQLSRQRLNEIPESLMTHAKSALQDTPENSPQRQQAAVAKLKEMSEDLSSYYDTVKKLDGIRYRKKTGINSSAHNTENTLKQMKHRIENKWQAIGRHNFLQTLSASHALLSVNVAPGAGRSTSNEAQTVVKDVLNLLKNVEIDHDKARLNSSSAFQKDIILQNRYFKVTGGGTIEALGQSGEVSISREWSNQIHPSRVRQGDYVNTETTVTGNLSANTAGSAITAIKQYVDGYSSDPSFAESDLADILPPDASDANYSYSRAKLTRQFRPEYRVASDYPGNKDFQTQFTRNTKTTIASASVGAVGPVTPGVNLGGELGYERSEKRMLSQKLGTQDLSFVLNILNRMHKNRASTPDAMENFFNQHHTEFSTIFANLGDPATGIAKEANYILAELVNRKAVSERDNVLNGLDIVANQAETSSIKKSALEAIETITRSDASTLEKKQARDVLEQSISAVPWRNIKESNPRSSALATLGLAGTAVFGKKLWGEGLSTKEEKARSALQTLVNSNRSGNTTSGEAARKTNVSAKSQQAVASAKATLNRIFTPLDDKSEYDKALTVLTAFANNFPRESPLYQRAQSSLNGLLQPEHTARETSSPPEEVQQRSLETLIRLTERYADKSSEKDNAEQFTREFTAAMAAYGETQSPENFERAKSAFFDFQDRQMEPWNEAHLSTWKTVPFTKKAAQESMNLHTQVLKKTGLHPRTRTQQQSTSGTPAQKNPTANVQEQGEVS